MNKNLFPAISVLVAAVAASAGTYAYLQNVRKQWAEHEAHKAAKKARPNPYGDRYSAKPAQPETI